MKYSIKFKVSVFRIAYLVCFLIIIVYGVFLLSFTKNVLGSVQSPELYTDQESGGLSKAWLEPYENGLKFFYVINQKVAYPYVGMAFPISEKLSGGFDNSDLLELEVYSDNYKKILIVITETITVYGRKKEQLLTRELELKSGLHKYTLPLSSFDYPSWWLLKHNISKADLSGFDVKSISTIAFQNDALAKSGQTDFYALTSFKIKKDLPVWFSVIPVFLLVVVELYNYVQKNRKLVTINFSPLKKRDEAKIDEWSVISDYIAKHFSNSELKLDVIQKETGVSKTRISELIKQTTGLSVKQYINQIRIHEAKEHLKSNDFSISEVAYRVGFANVSHFNRVFKEMTGKNPSDYIMGYLSGS